MEIPPTITNTHEYFQKVLPCFYKGSQKGDWRWFNPQLPPVLIWRGENSVNLEESQLTVTCSASQKHLENSFRIAFFLKTTFFFLFYFPNCTHNITETLRPAHVFAEGRLYYDQITSSFLFVSVPGTLGQLFFQKE